ncbi:MAG: flagellar motor switch protein FliM [Opitutales bacterium]|nr:flagellar motor switch protein FliM [Opitutales bacterium]
MMPPDPEDMGDVGADFLSQSDIDQLMADAGGDDSPACDIYSPQGVKYEDASNIHIETYDFRNPVFLTEIELRQVRIRHEQFIYYLAARLSMFLRMDFSLKMSKLHTTPYIKFTEAIPNPTHIVLFKVEQLAGVCVLDMSPRLAMTIIDRLLGGKGHSVREERYLTDIEISLMDDVISVILEEWCRQWEDLRELNASIVGRENNGRFLQTSPHDAIMLILTMEAAIGDCSDYMQVAVPYYTVEPIIKQMQEESKTYSRTDVKEKSMAWRSTYSDIKVPVVAEWDCFDVSVADILSLRPGDLIELPRDIIQKTKIRVEDTTCFTGEVGINEGQVAVKITDRNLNLT